MSRDASILTAISSLVGEERELRTQHVKSRGDPATHSERLQKLEAELDQCWDLLNQRRALRAVGASPDAAKLRPASQVQGYLR
ncbi:DUF2630 family protein [Nocardioides astragali]|uniref:DUF2630 family protein n=1 Tax=Nocardioides astragali TaxID=1776736 RepID=A0ABW2N4G9_9ACTN|nr:DUF2630 family protein [Nocardioides astragali]